MREFTQIASAGSISAAARALSLPRATLSRRLSGLEADLGVRLIYRRTNRLVLTSAGEELRLRAAKIIADVDAAWSSVKRLDDTPRGLLRVSVTGPYYQDLFTDFLADFPEVQLEVFSTTRHVDLIAEGVDVALRIGPIRDLDLIAKHLHSDRLLGVATPEYLSHYDAITAPEDLKSLNCIVGFAGDWAPATSWPLMDGTRLNIGGRLAANEIDLVKAAVLKDQGAALLPTAIISQELATGALVPILPDKIGAEIPISLVYADREFIDPKVRIFVDRAAKAISQEMPKPFDLSQLK